MSRAPAWHLERYRPLLRLQPRQLQLEPRLQKRFDSSDLVQETMLKAVEGLAGFRGQTEAELIKWLQEILANVAVDKVRHEHAQKRDVAKEEAIRKVVAESSARWEIPDNQSSPSEKVEKSEMLVRLATALEQLPEDQRDVIILRELQGVSVGQIAEQMGKTEKSVAGLLFRGKQRLRELLGDSISKG